MQKVRTLIAGAMVLSATGLIDIAVDEGFESKPYKDVAGVWTDGFGNTRNVNPTRHVSVTSGLFMLGEHTKESEQAINKCLAGVPLFQYEFDSYVRQAINIGNSGFCNSTTAKRAKAHDYVGACRAIMMWDVLTIKGQRIHCAENRGKVQGCEGIMRRRERTYDACMGQ